MKILAIFFWLFTITAPSAFAQELLLPLQHNPKKLLDNQNITPGIKSQAVGLTLPFRDDFSRPGPRPDPSLWNDNSVFVNTGLAVEPPTVGVASFDMLDPTGQLYEAATQTPFQFEADILTSLPILLGNSTPVDSVFLSFYFQPQGNGGSPRERDSLVVEFLKTPGHFIMGENQTAQWVPDQWVSVWRSTGQTLEEFILEGGTKFRRALIRITNPAFFYNGFKFRFKNYGSFAPPDQSLHNMAGNNNVWNIDYVLLDRNRRSNQTTYYDIAFAGPATSALRRYSAMPWSHFATNPQSHLKQNFRVQITNLGSIIYNYTYRYFVVDETDRAVRTYSGGSWNIAPFAQSGLQTFPAHANPIVLPNIFPGNQLANRSFRIVHVIREGLAGDSFQRNDTIAFHQVFDNYFAYDDGGPEAGYGLVGRNVKGAYRFILSHPDTLRAVQMAFNRTLNDQNQFPISITVWSSLQPEQVIYRSTFFRPDFDSQENGFITYRLQTPVAVQGTIFVGWEQRTEGFINLSYDANSVAGDNIFFNVGTGWLPSIFPGALMIRAIVGSGGPGGHQTQPQEPIAESSIFPNPIKDSFVNIRLGDSSISREQLRIEIFDLYGRLVLAQQYAPMLNLSNLTNGVYLLRITHPGNDFQETQRIIIAR